jgi:hypothetical protein
LFLIDDATSRLFCRFFPRDTGAANRQNDRRSHPPTRPDGSAVRRSSLSRAVAVPPLVRVTSRRFATRARRCGIVDNALSPRYAGARSPSESIGEGETPRVRHAGGARHGAHPAAWDKLVRNLRTGSMSPVGVAMPCPTSVPALRCRLRTRKDHDFRSRSDREATRTRQRPRASLGSPAIISPGPPAAGLRTSSRRHTRIVTRLDTGGPGE